MNNKTYLKKIEVAGVEYTLFDINGLEERGIANVHRLPFCIRVLVENLLRKLDNEVVEEKDLLSIAAWRKTYESPVEIPFHPSRVLTQDFTGVPAVVDLAAMRDAVGQMGGDPQKINPMVDVDLIIDHSVQVDLFGTDVCRTQNRAKEYERNRERYALLKWAQKSFDNFRIIPPGSGICHQVNLEYLSRVITTDKIDGSSLAYPESLIGTDSHTTMINSIGVAGWGVGGIEAEAVMLGQPYFMSIPKVVGVRLVNQLQPNISATDLALFVTQTLRSKGMVDKFVEFLGPGMKTLSVVERATIANMAPEYGATMGFMPIDEKTVEYFYSTGRSAQAEVIKACAKAMGLFYTGGEAPEYTELIEIDLSDVEPSVAGPSRPSERIPLKELKNRFSNSPKLESGKVEQTGNGQQVLEDPNVPSMASDKSVLSWKSRTLQINNKLDSIRDSSVVLASITSCTNTSNPFVLMGAGLLAKNAVKRGLHVPAFVKTSLAPGSKVVNRYLENADLMPYLEALGFHVVGFGCLTCIGNSGPLDPNLEKLIKDNDLNTASVISGNRNFEARIHPAVKSNFLASPLMVVAFALSGRIDIDFETEPIGLDPNGTPVFLEEIWPEDDLVAQMVQKYVKAELFEEEYNGILDGDYFWRNLKVKADLTFAWDETSTYIKKPPYFDGFTLEPEELKDIKNARALVVLGDGVTTDHISPGGSIRDTYPAGLYLIQCGVEPKDFNSYGSRRGNHEVMVRGTFGNVRLKNRMVEPKEGSFSQKFPEGETMHIFDAAMTYAKSATPLIVLAGKEYGTGSSRDWAAKGTRLLGIRAVLAESFERIHKSNLVGMGVLPLVFVNNENVKRLGLDGSETFDIQGVGPMEPRQVMHVTAFRIDGTSVQFDAMTRLDTQAEVLCFTHGGILPYVLRKILTTK